MNLYEITIKPGSAFATSLKGDTIFGHFCWQAAYDSSLLKGGLEKSLENYHSKPFAVFSSAFLKIEESKGTRYVFKRPDIPFRFIKSMKGLSKKQRIEKAKENKKKKWMILSRDFKIDLEQDIYFEGSDVIERHKGILTQETGEQMKKTESSSFIVNFSQSHNTINRLNQRTGTGAFAPYTLENFIFYPETELVIFVLIDGNITDIDRILKGLERIGQWGFGKDASTGMGRFGIGEYDEVKMPESKQANACYTLSPSVPEKGIFIQSFFFPFTRFGKHGDRLARGKNPFKNPVIMADEGAVFIPENKSFFQKPYMGTAVTDVSKADKKTFVQGYAPYIPMKLEV